MKKLILGLALLLVAPGGKAQFYFYNDRYLASDWELEAGLSPGLMNCLTDLGARSKSILNDVDPGRWHFNAGFFINVSYREAVVIRLDANLGSVESSDPVFQTGSSSPTSIDRNLDFKSRISELLLGFEIHPLYFLCKQHDRMLFLSPYFVGGMGIYCFDPQAALNGQWYPLQPLRTEGEGFPEFPGRKPYALTQLNLPLGLGLRYEVNAIANIRLELLYRLLFTDYLDDVSQADYIDPILFDKHLPPPLALLARQLYDRRTNPGRLGQRGNPGSRDAYFSIQMKLGLCFRKLIRSR